MAASDASQLSNRSFVRFCDVPICPEMLILGNRLAIYTDQII